MNKLFTIISLIFCFSASANTLVIGTGSGSVSKTSMSGLSAGDTLGITAGTYSGGGAFGNLNNITIINYGGIVTFTASVDWGVSGSAMPNVTWTGVGGGAQYGFIFDATGTYGAGPVGYTTNSGFVFSASNYTLLRMNHIWFKHISSNCFDVSGGNQPTYNGTTGSFRIYQSTFSYCRADNCLEFWQGSYAGFNKGFIDSIDISNNIINQTSGNGLTVNTEATNFNIHDNQILYTGYNTLTNDVGVFSMAGFGQVHHNYMKGGRGHLARIAGASFKGGPVGTFYGYDNIKLGTTTYGMFDLRTDSLNFFAPLSNFFQHCNFQVVHNTAGNLTANDDNGTGSGNGFNTPVALFYVLDGGATGVAKDNLAFNTVFGNSGGNVVISFASSGFAQVDTSNNRYFIPSLILNALSDTSAQCAVKTGASIIGQGLVFANVPVDYTYYSFSSPPTIGSREYQSPAVVCSAGSNTTQVLPPTNTATLDATASTGSITTYLWTVVSAPITPNITSPTSSISGVTGMTATGLYIFQQSLNGGATTCTRQIQVNAHTIPTANSGSPQTITLPVATVTLTGSGSVFDGASISTYAWSKISGGAGSITSPSSASTTVTGLVQGTYVFQLIVTDSYGSSSIASTVTITVNPVINSCPFCVVRNEPSQRLYTAGLKKGFY